MNKFASAIGVCLLLGACASQPPPPATVPLPLPPPSGEPPGFVGKSANDLRATFGAPSFVRKENGAEMWRYDSKDCRAFFFLYTKDNAQTVRHVETLPHGRDNAADFTCLNFLREHRPPVS
jgi:hypothetical protein